MLVMKAKYEKLSKARRFETAVRLVLDEGWTQKAAAEEVGVSRQHLNVKVKQARVDRAERAEQAKADLAAGRTPRVQTVERRRTMSFEEFDRRYFGNWVCPDCGVHHEMPQFHREIAEAVQSDARRVVINMPPYHSKSTNVTVKDTVYDICMNPDLRTLIVSKSLPFARTFMYSIQELLTNEELYEGAAGNLIADFGPFKPSGSSVWNSEQIYVVGRTTAEKDPTVQVLGVGAQIYGRRADKIKFDDIATLENQRNPERVQQMLEWIDKEALSRIGRNGKAIWVGTRVHAGDIYSVLQQRSGYVVLRYPVLLDDERELVLWPDHFPYEQVMIHREEMTPADFQLVYQNVDIPGVGAAFPPELVDEAKDPSRLVGHYETGWRLIAGLDPAGANKGSGYTAFTLLAVDLQSGKRFVVDQVAVKAMKAPQMKEQILDWSFRYPIYEWRVEANGLQSQLVQYDYEIIRTLAQRGIRVTPHYTQANKWDPQFGVESMAPLMSAGLFSIPWGSQQTQATFRPFIEELISFPMGTVSDRVMSTWFAELGARDLLKRSHMPLFNDRMRMPNRIRRRRRIVNFQNQTVEPVPLKDQYAGHLTSGQWGYRRLTVGRPLPYDKVQEAPPPEPETPVNIDPTIWN